MPITKATASSVAPAAKGDLVVGSATNDASVLAVGTNNYVLTADSAETTGLKWAAASSGSMTLISTTTLSGASTTISGISGGFNQLTLFIFRVTNDTSAGQFRCAPNTLDNITSQSSNFGTDSTLSKLQNDYLFLSGTGVGAAAMRRLDSKNFFRLNIYRYAGTSNEKGFDLTGGYVRDDLNRTGTFSSGFINTADAITSLVFSNTGGHFSAGTIQLYGVN